MGIGMKIKQQKPDTDKARRILYRAMIRICKECGLQYDWASFIVVTQAVTSKTIAEVVGSDDLMKDGGEGLIKHALALFESMLREDFAGRIEHERKQTRQ